MVRLSLLALFAMSLGTLTIAAAALPAPAEIAQMASAR